MTGRVSTRGSVAGGALVAGAALMGPTACEQAGGDVAIDDDDSGGVVTGPNGPEAGVWVIAEKLWLSSSCRGAMMQTRIWRRICSNCWTTARRKCRIGCRRKFARSTVTPGAGRRAEVETTIAEITLVAGMFVAMVVSIVTREASTDPG